MKLRSRESFLQLVVILLVVFALTSCTGSAGTSSQQTPEPEKQVGVYLYGSPPTTDFDPSVSLSDAVIVQVLCYETLLKYDPSNDTFEPILATSYKKSDDNLTWTFQLRKGVKFHDGTDFNAEAVKFSILRTRDLGKGPAFIWDPLQDINVVDEYTVEFKLKFPAPVELMAASAYGAFIMSPTAVKSHPDDWLAQGNDAGTGPYKVMNFRMGEEVDLEKFDGYWRGWEGKHFDAVVIKKVSESSTRRMLIEKGEGDVTEKLASEDVEALKKNPNAKVVVTPYFQNLFLLLNIQRPPLDNKLVRQALSYAFPYDDVVKYAMGGYATQARGAVPNGLWGHGDNLFQYKYDLNKAKELLTQAGYPDGGFKIEMRYMTGTESVKRMAELYKAELSKLNINLEIRGMPWDTYWDMAKSSDPSQHQDIFVTFWWPDIASPYSFLYSLFHSQESYFFNLTYWKNAEYDKLIDDGSEMSGIDKSKASELFIKAQEILIDEAVAIFTYDEQYVVVLNSSVKGFVDNPAYARCVFFYDMYRE